MKHTIRRTFLVRRVQTWIVTTDNDDLDIRHAVAAHMSEFDDDLTDGGDPLEGWTSEQVSEDTEAVDYNELNLEVVDRQPATVLPFRRRNEVADA